MSDAIRGARTTSVTGLAAPTENSGSFLRSTDTVFGPGALRESTTTRTAARTKRTAPGTSRGGAAAPRATTTNVVSRSARARPVIAARAPSPARARRQTPR